jgi:predicted outer membrane repeat protein
MLFGACTGGTAGDTGGSPAGSLVEPQIYYVVSAADSGGDGMSWETALTHPQDALDIAVSGDQIWVAEGDYGPREAEDRNVVVLKTGVHVFGGFSGTESEAGMRDPQEAVTILNGQDYAYHVVLAKGVEGAILDGFTITGGKAFTVGIESAEGGMFNGGGIFSAYSSLEVRQCRFTGNAASHKGGAVYSEESESTLMDCTFEMNTANFGGALDNYRSLTTVINSIFTSNQSETSGGAVNNLNSSATFVNTVFSGNHSGWTGGAVLSNSSDTVFTNCTFSGNRCQIKPGGAVSLYEGKALLINCILWRNLSQDPSSIWSENAEIDVRYSIVEGGSEGDENLDLEPDFMRDGIWDGTDNWIEGDYQLAEGSAAIDSGTADGAPNFDLVGEMRPQELAHDRGAYEHSEEQE